MNFLVIETSGQDSFVLLVKPGWQLSAVSISPRHQALAQAVELILSVNKQSLANLDFIATGSGPGSFTGTRVGVSMAQGLSFAAQRPLIGICSLTRLTPPQHREGRFMSLFPLKRGDFYALQGERRNGDLLFDPQGPQLIEHLPPTQDCLLIRPEGSGHVASTHETAPNLPFFAQLAWNSYQANQQDNQLKPVVVTYLHGPSSFS